MTSQIQSFCPSCGAHNALQELPVQKIKTCRVCGRFFLICPACSSANKIARSEINLVITCSSCSHQFNYQQAL